jgi:hypothetical protein
VPIARRRAFTIVFAADLRALFRQQIIQGISTMIHRFTAYFVPAFIAVVAIAAFEQSARAGVILGDLQQDWSFTNNPNTGTYGTWSLNQGSSLLSQVTNWVADPRLSGWGPAANRAGDFLPFWSKITGIDPPYDAPVGSVMLHTTDPFNGGGNGPANATWTTNFTGIVTISGDLWAPLPTPGRYNDYQVILTHGASHSILASGNVLMDGSNSSSNPIPFSIGNQFIAAGDTVELLIAEGPTSSAGFFTGAELTISADVTSTPEPMSLAVWTVAFSVAGIGVALRRSRGAEKREDGG